MCLTGSANPAVLVHWAKSIHEPKELDTCRSQFRKTLVIITVIVLAAIATVVIGTLALKEIYFSMSQTSAAVCIGLGGLMILFNAPDVKRLYDTNVILTNKRAQF